MVTLPKDLQKLTDVFSNSDFNKEHMKVMYVTLINATHEAYIRDADNICMVTFLRDLHYLNDVFSSEDQYKRCL